MVLGFASVKPSGHKNCESADLRIILIARVPNHGTVDQYVRREEALAFETIRTGFQPRTNDQAIGYSEPGNQNR
jgi:hypothetical protein